MNGWWMLAIVNIWLGVMNLLLYFSDVGEGYNLFLGCFGIIAGIFGIVVEEAK